MPATHLEEVEVNTSGNDPQLSPPVEIFGDIEAEARGFAYGAMLFEVKPGCSTEPHQHGSEETWQVRRGRGRAVIGDQEIELAAGSRLSIPPQTRHVVTNIADEDLTIVAFWWRETDHGG